MSRATVNRNAKLLHVAITITLITCGLPAQEWRPNLFARQRDTLNNKKKKRALKSLA